MTITLTEKVFLNAITSAVSTSWYETDYRYTGDQERTVFGTKNTSDVITVEAVDTSETAAAIVVVASVGTGVTDVVATVNGPYPKLRVTKTGANGAATIIGVV